MMIGRISDLKKKAHIDSHIIGAKSALKMGITEDISNRWHREARYKHVEGK